MGARELKLERPLVSFDLETTGLDVHDDRIVEISCVKILEQGDREIRTYRLNPGRPISPEAISVHGIVDADVSHEPSFADLAQELLEFLSGADLTGFNLAHFDLPLLTREFERVGIQFPAPNTRVIDSRRIYTLKEPRDLSAAYRFYCDAELSGAHGAEADAKAAADILLAQIRKYTDLPTDLDDLEQACQADRRHWVDSHGKFIWKNNDIVFGFGKYFSKKLRSVVAEDPGYLKWMLQSSFSDDVVGIVEQALLGHFPARSDRLCA